MTSPHLTTTATSAALALVQALDPPRRQDAQRVLDRLLAWSQRHATLIRFDEGNRDTPGVRFIRNNDGRILWLACKTTNGDAKVEIRTRTAGQLPDAVLNELRDSLRGIFPDEQLADGKVLQAPMRTLATPSALDSLCLALEFVLGATAATDG